MHTTKTLVSATIGMVLLAGNVTVATAHLVNGEEAWSQRAHTAYRNLRCCEPDFNQSAESDVIFEQVNFLTGAGYFTDKFTIDTAGAYRVTLTDFEFPNPLAEAGLNITSANESFGSLFGPGSFTFDADPGSYYLNFFGKAPDLGQYGIEIAQFGIVISQPANLSAVPIPAAAWLFGSGLIGLAGVGRGKFA